jgi:protein dithiol oxidoreductase (disulfide-forming)
VKSLHGQFLLGIALWFAAAAACSQALPVAGRDYQELSPARAVSTGERIEVLEFFYYGCPVCYESQPHIARWLMRAGPGVAILRVPAVFTESSESFARTFYTLGAMNHIARLHWPLYDNHHFDGKQLNVEKNVVEWVAGNGVNRERFVQLWQSDEVKAQIEAAKKALDTYQVKGVPSFVVDGKYVTSAKMAGGVREMMRVVEYLTGRAGAERKK